MTKELTEHEKKLDEIIQNSKFETKADVVLVKLQPGVHALTKEEQVYFKSFTEDIFGHNEQSRNRKIKQLSTDYHVRIILPYLCTFIKDKIRFNLAFPDLIPLIYSARMVEYLLINKHINLKPYIHEILPAILSCCVAKHISVSESHWALRQYAAMLVASICKAYSDDFNDMKQRTIAIYNKGILDENKELTTAFGAIKGLKELGEEVVKDNLIPKIMIINNKIQRAMKIHDSSGPGDKDQSYQKKLAYLAATIVRDATVMTCAPILYKIGHLNYGRSTYERNFGHIGKFLYDQVLNFQVAIQMGRLNPVNGNQNIGNPNVMPNPENLAYFQANGNHQNTISTQANENQNVSVNNANGMPSPGNE